MTSIKMAKLTEDLQICADHIKAGELVAFPTETVYGLGANALNPEAIQKIFLAKKRPLTDPVIVHISSWVEVESLINEPDLELLSLAESLAERFWPGPLTLVLRRSSLISDYLTAGTDFVGVRCPNHPTALSLINLSKCPIAAPSANLFAHVSPTRPSHVIDDFNNSDFSILVLDGGPCSFGIESTVAKFERIDGTLVLQVLRRGGINQEALQEALQDRAKVKVRQNFSGIDSSQEAPGQLLKHYSPNIETYLLTSNEDPIFLDNNQDLPQSPEKELENLGNIEETILIQFGSDNSRPGFKARVSLSENKNIPEAIQNLYNCLRIAEGLSGKLIVIEIGKLEGEHASALWDRIFRATSGREVIQKGKNILKLN
jgi:tRNA threonylcarbamoyl adenosine modification protein (Sua5/YciO/YrdC/YwlC family)